MIKSLLSVMMIHLVLMTGAWAEEITTVKGKTYHNISVTRVDPDGINITHSAGVGKLYFSELPKELQTKYGYDPEKHRQYYNAQQKAAQQAGTMRALGNVGIDVKAKLSQVLDDGSLAYITVVTTFTYTERVTTDPHADTSKRFYGTVQSVESKDVVREHVSVSEEEEPVFISGLSSGYVDGDTWSGTLYQIGTYSYTTTFGAPKKVRKYTPSRAVAAQYYSE